MGGIHSTRDVCALHATVIVRCGKPAPTCSRFHYHAHRRLCSVYFACKANDKIFFITSIFYLLFICLIDNIFILPAMVLGRELSPMDLLVEKHVQSDDCQNEMQQFVDSQAQHFVVCWFSTIFFIKL